MWERLKLCCLAQSPGLKDLGPLFQLKNVMYFLPEFQGVTYSTGENRGSSSEVSGSAGINRSSRSDMYYLIKDGSDTTITSKQKKLLLFCLSYINLHQIISIYP